MANIMKFGGTTLSLSDMGFVNVPDGKWVLNSGSKSISANSDYIPLAVSSCGTSYAGKTVGSQFTHGDYWDGNYSTRTNYNVFLPHLFNWDCAQLRTLSGTFTLWLEKVE